MKTKFLKFLVGELLVIAAVIVVFSLIKTKITAGAVAGSLFVALGLWIVGSGFLNAQLRRSGTFVMGCVHLFAVALPMMITRLVNATMPFEDIKILGLPGPAFHKLSTGVYFVLMAATLLDFVLAWRREKKFAA